MAPASSTSCGTGVSDSQRGEQLVGDVLVPHDDRTRVAAGELADRHGGRGDVAAQCPRQPGEVPDVCAVVDGQRAGRGVAIGYQRSGFSATVGLAARCIRVDMN